MSDQNNTPPHPKRELTFQMQAMMQMMERMNFVMGNVCDKLDRVEKHGNEAGTSTQNMRKLGAKPKANNGSRAERLRWADYEDFEEAVNDIGDGGFESQPTRDRDVKCFKCLGKGHIASQCPNRRVMLRRDNGEVEYESDKSKIEEMPPLVDCSDEEIAYPVEGEAWVIRCAVNMQIKDDDIDQQRENIFHTRCDIQNKVCSMIIDGGSCANVASDTLVKKLNLSCVKHLRPYRLQWLNECGEVRVTKQVVIAFAIGKYSDEILCDVVPMHASHLLLGRPWQFDRKAIHDGFRNRFTIVKDGKTITLVPLSPKQVYDDQMKLKKECEDGKSENSHEDNGERKPSNSAKPKSLIKPVESGGKNRGVKKVSLCDDNSVEKLKKQPNFYAKGSQIRSAFFTNKPMILLVYKEAYFNTNDLDYVIPSVAVSLMQEFDDVFPEDIPNGLLLLRGIEHQIDLVPGASIPNRPAYGENLFSYLSKLNKEIQANQGGATTQIFQIRFLLVYLGLLKGDKSDSTIFSMIIFGILLFLLFSS